MDIVILVFAIIITCAVLYRVLFWEHELKYRIVKIFYGNNSIKYRIEHSNGIHWYGITPEYDEQKEAQEMINIFLKDINDNRVIDRQIL